MPVKTNYIVEIENQIVKSLQKIDGVNTMTKIKKIVQHIPLPNTIKQDDIPLVWVTRMAGLSSRVHHASYQVEAHWVWRIGCVLKGTYAIQEDDLDNIVTDIEFTISNDWMGWVIPDTNTPLIHLGRWMNMPQTFKESDGRLWYYESLMDFEAVVVYNMLNGR